MRRTLGLILAAESLGLFPDRTRLQGVIRSEVVLAARCGSLSDGHRSFQEIIEIEIIEISVHGYFRDRPGGPGGPAAIGPGNRIGVSEPA